MQKPFFEVRDLKKFYPIYEGVFQKQTGFVHALNGVNFSLYPGEALGVVGESGCGKSTLGRAAIRLIEPSFGSIYFEGRDFLALGKKELIGIRQKMQMIFQDPHASLNPRKTVFQTILEPMRHRGLVSCLEKEQREKVAYLLEQVGLSSNLMDRYPHSFSGGQKQRLSIARALSVHPRLLICDEPVSALDVSIQAQILNLLLDLKERLNLTYLFISHDLSVVRHFCNRVIVMYLGKVMESAPTELLFSSPKHPYTKALFSSMLKNHPREKRSRLILKGEVPSSVDPPSGCPFRTRCPYAQPVCKHTPPKRIKQTDLGERLSHCILELD